MRVLLLNPLDDLADHLGEGANLVHPFEPLGLLYIAAAAEVAGHDVQVVDAQAEGLSPKQVMKRIEAFQPAVVGISTLTSNGAMVFDIGRQIKTNQPDAFVVLGNIHASVFAEVYLRHGCCDGVIHGEGEENFVRLLEQVSSAEPNMSEIPCLSYLAGDEFRTNPGDGTVRELDQLPPPARHLVRPEFYRTPAFHVLPINGRHINAKHLFTSRGCPNRCTFCAVTDGRKPRRHSLEQVMTELQQLVGEQGANYIFFMDSLFTCNRKRVLELCEAIRSSDLSFRWGCEGHVRHLDPELIRAMEAVGCHDIALGIESGVQSLLDAVCKGISLDQVRETVAMIKKNSNIMIQGLFMLGLPGETPADSQQTIRFATSLPLDRAQFGILVPYPGTPMFEELRERGEIDTGVRPDGTVDPTVWRRYGAHISFTNHDPIWHPEGMSGAELRNLQKRALRSFYLRPRQIFEQVMRIQLKQLPRIIRTAWQGFF